MKLYATETIARVSLHDNSQLYSNMRIISSGRLPFATDGHELH